MSEPLVLIVDDYPDSREMCAEFLRFSGFRVEEAVDGLQAVEKATSLVPNVVLMDLSLPGIDGVEATRRIRANERTKHVPIIALTGHAQNEHADSAKAAGCDAFLTKPCAPDAMVKEIRRLLEGGAA